jgi:hypothetical protein
MMTSISALLESDGDVLFGEGEKELGVRKTRLKSAQTSWRTRWACKK